MKDHIELGKELDIFVQSPDVGKGLPLFTEKGSIIRRELIRFVEDSEIARGYLHTSTPVMASRRLFEISGHWELYREHMFRIDMGDDETYALRPMTCPFHFELYKRKVHSYRELPLRYAETALLFRDEAGGAIHGINRTRQFTLSDGHIICGEDQIEREFLGALDLVETIMERLGIDDFWLRFSTRGQAFVGGDPAGIDSPEDSRGKQGKFIDNNEAWELSEAMLRGILENSGLEFVEGPGEAAFYGPKLDIQLKDVLGREETLFTLQLDFALPERFGMYYIDESDQRRTPFVIHRSSIGCYERTMAHILERSQGRLPFWLSPVQVVILPVSGSQISYARLIAEQLNESGVRAQVDAGDESLGRRIRQLAREKVPVVCIVGEREYESDRVTVRLAGWLDSRRYSGFGAISAAGLEGLSMDVEEFKELCAQL